MFLNTIDTPGLAHLSYLVGDTSAGLAAVIDPRRDIDVYIELARAQQVRIAYVLETHVHADYVSGARLLAECTGAEMCGGPGADYAFEHRALREGETIEVGGVSLRVLHTPGHTPEHVCFLAAGGRGAAQPWGLFTGDTLFAGEVGRPDLLGKGTEQQLAHTLFHTLHERILPLGDETVVYPAHGQGSPCGASIGDRNTTTIGYERRYNPRLQVDDADAFVRDVLETAPPAPRYYPRMKRVNVEGATAERGPPPRPLRAAELRAELEADDTLVVDVREIAAFGGSHIPRSLSIPLRSAFPVWVGWMLEPGTPVVLVVEEPAQLAPALADMRRVGFDDVAGWLLGGVRGWIEAGHAFERTTQLSVHELRKRIDGGDALQVLDVRAPTEWQAGRIPNARHIFLPELEARAHELSDDEPIAVYCGSGFRASIAASVLERRGLRGVHNVPGSFSGWKAAGYPVVGAA